MGWSCQYTQPAVEVAENPWRSRCVLPNVCSAAVRTSALNRLDVRICVGREPRDLRRKHERCQFLNGTVSEMWDFSWSNLDHCASSLWAPRLRYIPPGYLGRPNVRASSPTLNSKTMLFIGTLTDFHAKERRRTYRSLKQRLGGRLQHTSEQGEHQRICPQPLRAYEARAMPPPQIMRGTTPQSQRSCSTLMSS